VRRARVAGVAVLALALAAGGARAQAPSTLSRRLVRALDRDTTVRAWLIARPHADLAALAAAVRALGGRVRVTSRYINAVSADLPGTALRAATRLRDVVHVQPVAAYIRQPEAHLVAGVVRTLGGAPAEPVRAQAPDTLYGQLAWVVDQLHVRTLHQRGLRGAGVRIAMLDAGFNTLQPLMAGADIVAQHDFVYGDSVVRDQPGETQGEMTHGTATWSLLAANRPGTLYGLVPEAQFLLAKTEYTPTETRVEEDNWVAAVEWADSIGVDIISSSLGYRTFDNGFSYAPSDLNGDVAVTTVAADSAAARGDLVVVAVGNGGPSAMSLLTPADGDSVVAAGATDSLGQVASFSSRGPTADGRIKPDVLAPGVLVPVAQIDSGVYLLNGTSFSTPLIAGVAALVQGARPSAPAVELREGLIAAGAFHHAPDNTHRNGIPDARALLAWPAGLRTLGGADTLLPSAAPTLAWSGGEPPVDLGPSLYRLRVAHDAAMTTTLLDTTVLEHSLTLPPLQPGTRLFWRVTGSNDDLAASESTAVRGPDVVPPWVTLETLASPAGQSIRDTLPVLAWSPASVPAPPGPFLYDVDVYPAARGPSEAVASARGISDTTFRPTTPLERNLPYRWRVVAHLGADSSIVTSAGTFVVLDESVPNATVLFQNFPNPFPNAAVGLTTTCFWFDVAQTGPVELAIYDLRGRLMRRLTPNPASGLPAELPAGRYGRPSSDATGTCDPRFSWDGRDETGAYVRPGVYLYRLTAPGFRDSHHVVFLGAP